MIELYEPAACKDSAGRPNGLLTVGSDAFAIEYPSVDSCLTITLVYANTMVGAHFGLMDANGIIPPGFVTGILNEMRNIHAPAGTPTDALIIGQIGLWEEANAPINLIRELAVTATNPKHERDSADVHKGASDITIYKDGSYSITSRNTSAAVIEYYNKSLWTS
jgi:hypothetical protein